MWRLSHVFAAATVSQARVVQEEGEETLWLVAATSHLLQVSDISLLSK